MHAELRRGLDVIGLAPAALPPLDADLATLTGNVAQVFLEDAAWIQALRGIRGALAADGLLVFETRDPARAAWLRWTPQRTARTIQAPGAGTVRTWCQVTPVDGPFVDFRWTFEFEFEADGARLVSSSRLRFRGRSEIEASLACSGFVVVDVLDAQRQLYASVRDYNNSRLRMVTTAGGVVTTPAGNGTRVAAHSSAGLLPAQGRGQSRFSAVAQPPRCSSAR